MVSSAHQPASQVIHMMCLYSYVRFKDKGKSMCLVFALMKAIQSRRLM